MADVEIGTCRCGGYGIVYDRATALEMGRCHDPGSLDGRPTRPLVDWASVVAENLRGWRYECGLSLGALAGRSGITKSYLWKLERGQIANPGTATLDRIAQALGVDVVDMLVVADTEGGEG